MIRRLVILKCFFLSRQFEIIECFNSSIVFILHSFFDFIRCENAIILEKIHQKSHLLINIISHRWNRTVDFAFLYLKTRFLDFERDFLHLRSRKHWNRRILKSTTIKSLRFECLFYFFNYFVFFSFSFFHNHLFRMNAIFFCSDRFFRFRSDFFLHDFFAFSDLIFSKTNRFIFDQNTFEWDSKCSFIDVFFRLFSRFFSHICFEKRFRCIAR